MKKFFSFVLFLSALFLGDMAMAQLAPDGITIAPIGAIGAIACRTLQGTLLEYFGRNIGKFRTGGSTAFIKWLLSPQNTSGFKRINVESIPGKKRGVAFRVDLPFCFSLCALNVACDAQNIQYVDPDSGEMVFDLTNPPYRHCDANGDPVRLRFKEEDLMKYCTETDQSFITNKIAQYLLEWEQALDKVLTTVISSKVGTTLGGDSVVNLPIFVQASNTAPGISVLNPDAAWAMDQLFVDAGLDGNYAMIGGPLVQKFAAARQWRSANDAGVDLSKVNMDQPLPFFDRNFSTTFGTSDFLMMAPGVAQLVTWNKYKGEKRRQVTNLYSKGTVVLPTTGLEVDWKWWYDYECEEWIFEAFLYAEIATVPPGGCAAAGDGVETFNGIIRVADCGIVPLVPECPEPEA